ncbi:MAG: N-methyl-L-tryptophan oxidase [Planctomycetales bacterium]|nr:N-methyl-L-tryptophan oxidase [Planctomycetales bacterium]
MRTWDVIVVGLGGVGSATAMHLSRQGLQVLGIEQYSRLHDKGSSHGETRVIRQAYFEHPDYVPLLLRAYTLWDELEQDSAEALFVRCGLVEVGPSNGIVIPGVVTAARKYDLPLDVLEHRALTSQWPQLRVPAAHACVVERNAGFLRVESCVEAHLSIAERFGAELRFETPLLSWRPTPSGVEVETPDCRFAAGALVIAGGSWTSNILQGANIPLRVLHKVMYWFEPTDHSYRLENGFPCFFYETEAGFFYGFPDGGGGLKVARHSGGKELSMLELPCDPENTDPLDEQLVRAFVSTNLPATSGKILRRANCLYTMTPDEHFVVDYHPEHKHIVVVAGLSGHGFKFTSVLGEMASQLVLHNTNHFYSKLFAIDRFGT